MGTLPFISIVDLVFVLPHFYCFIFKPVCVESANSARG